MDTKRPLSNRLWRVSFGLTLILLILSLFYAFSIMIDILNGGVVV
ncbi:MAG: hypothetical protein RLP44_20355 [Aggregatilineales bacterium]